MDIPPSAPVPETIEESVAASDAVLTRLEKLLTATQGIVFSTRRRISDSRTIIADANTLRMPAAHPVQSREGFLPSELLVAT